MKPFRIRTPLVLTNSEQQFICQNWRQMTAQHIATAINQATPQRIKQITRSTIYRYVRRARRLAYAQIAAFDEAEQTAQAVALRARIQYLLPNKRTSLRQAMELFFYQHNPLQEVNHG
jgi:hypothetical protein